MPELRKINAITFANALKAVRSLAKRGRGWDATVRRREIIRRVSTELTEAEVTGSRVVVTALCVQHPCSVPLILTIRLVFSPPHIRPQTFSPQPIQKPESLFLSYTIYQPQLLLANHLSSIVLTYRLRLTFAIFQPLRKIIITSTIYQCLTEL